MDGSFRAPQQEKVKASLQKWKDVFKVYPRFSAAGTVSSKDTYYHRAAVTFHCCLNISRDANLFIHKGVYFSGLHMCLFSGPKRHVQHVSQTSPLTHKWAQD